jgi:Zn ribbon nucleic-acid-binding protein
MSFVRCSRCQARRTLAKNIKKYVRLPRCRRCGHNHYYVDHFRTNVERRRKACYCHRLEPWLGSLYWFPHRRGSKFCGHSSFTVDDARKSRFNPDNGG